MNVKIITVPFDPAKEVFQDEFLSNFLANKPIHTLNPQFFQHQNRPYWTVFVEYEPVLSDAETLPTKTTLTDQQRVLFQRLRVWRKEQAEQDKVPVFILATNEQLENVAIHKPVSSEALRQIRGFGRKKLEQYGPMLIAMVKAHEKENTQENSSIQEEIMLPTTESEP